MSKKVQKIANISVSILGLANLLALGFLVYDHIKYPGEEVPPDTIVKIRNAAFFIIIFSACLIVFSLALLISKNSSNKIFEYSLVFIAIVYLAAITYSIVYKYHLQQNNKNTKAEDILNDVALIYVVFITLVIIALAYLNQ